MHVVRELFSATVELEEEVVREDNGQFLSDIQEQKRKYYWKQSGQMLNENLIFHHSLQHGIQMALPNEPGAGDFMKLFLTDDFF